MRSFALSVFIFMNILFPINVHAKISQTILPHNEQVFEHLCLKGKKECLYMNVYFLSKTNLRTTWYMYYRITSKRALTEFNSMAERYPTGIANDLFTRSVDYINHVNGKWTPSSGAHKCQYCIDLNEYGADDNFMWVRVIRTRQTEADDNTFLVVGTSVNRWEPKLVRVNAFSTPGTNIYLDGRSNSVHMSSPPRKADGTFEVIMNNDWVKSTQPDYVTISTVPSWRAVARSYIQKQNVILSKIKYHSVNNHKNDDAIIDKVVHYIASMGWKSETKMTGAFPHRQLSDIIESKTGDCKAYASVLEAALLEAGIISHPVLINHEGLPPLSFSVPSQWFDHVILYVPSADTFIDMTIVIGSKGQYGWRSSASFYKGDIALDAATGNFVVVH